ncbi:protein of unknown function [Pseudobutyrivibrio ruminis]|uniref:DUF1836 domain-containing protein n=2 Tax=Pseudobutyrivibrio ruminis TaxID=46206 RepID=A0A1H7F022_9FIRM|nr:MULTISPECIES: DUF1836 domain-containing protein [Pseudobutyrivibrio]SEK17662.1 protein of unknown function [Pseudobutyrivibrio ruminis]SES87183.1 protein of unknown function [Pseudobutyrivibrio sp. C4]SFO08219.1 protein of unknown function [Pseudobutyrivibrio sp. JW11]SOC01850.1 protein of unknown function [Pseudobutyrivibrio ruminis DSM 9787]
MDNSRKRLNEILHQLAEIDYVHPEDIPNIDLYMDQVLTFLDQELGTVREATEDKAMTKTMINNYTKNQILPSPEKKKYSRDHMLNLIFIYYLKNFLSMKEIKNILDPINTRYFGSKEGLGFYDIYSAMVGYESKVASDVTKDIIRKYNISKQAFADQDEESRAELQEFTFICELAFDVFVKKMMIEQYLAQREDKPQTKEESSQENPM